MANKTEMRQILTSIRKGDIKPVYLLIGRDTYFIDVILGALERYAI